MPEGISVPAGWAGKAGRPPSCCACSEKRQPVARHDSVTGAVTEHGTPLPRPAPPSRSLSPPLEPLDDGTVRVW